jgi:DnaK suppressor protein
MPGPATGGDEPSEGGEEPGIVPPAEPSHDLHDELRARLEAERGRAERRIAALTRDLEDIVERSAEAVRDDEHDPEGATIAFERAQVAAVLDATRTKLAEVDHANDRLQRLQPGEPVRCERCGSAIPVERLLARPTSRTCVRCAAD